MTSESDLAIDNDVILKLACYCLLDQLSTVTNVPIRHIHILGAARYVLTSVIRRSTRIQDKDRARTNLLQFIDEAAQLEPDESEISLATDIEELALIYGVDLDAGESQLCAIVINRLFDVLITGDKRAVRGLQQLVDAMPAVSVIEGRIASLEQLLARYVLVIGAQRLRRLICSERDVDKAVSICCGCSSLSTPSSPLGGLLSYIKHQRSDAPRVLSPSYEVG